MRVLALSVPLVLLSISHAADACPLASDYAINPPNMRAYAPVSPTCTGGAASPCGDHHVAVPSDLTTLREPLLLFLPGTSMEPDKHDLVLRMAAYAGYRTIGLSYDNRTSANSACGGTPCTDECHYKMRGEVLTGNNWSPQVAVIPDDSVVTRLYRLLEQLYVDDMANGIDDWGWGNYYVPLAPGQVNVTAANLRWDRMVVSGFSQGSGHAALISIEQHVQGLVLLEGAHDRCDNAGVPEIAWYYNNPNASAGMPRYGALHRRGLANAPIPASWITLGLSSIDHDVDSTPLPLTSTVVSTDQVVPAGPMCSAHMSVARDQCMPTDAVSGISTTAPDAVHLYEAYFEMFCSI